MGQGRGRGRGRVRRGIALPGALGVRGGAGKPAACVRGSCLFVVLHIPVVMCVFAAFWVCWSISRMGLSFVAITIFSHQHTAPEVRIF